jgi:hypothetical protein
VILNPNDPSAVLGVDNPVEDEVAQSNSNNPILRTSESEMNDEVENVTMIVVDGIVVGTKVFYIYNV